MAYGKKFQAEKLIRKSQTTNLWIYQNLVLKSSLLLRSKLLKVVDGILAPKGQGLPGGARLFFFRNRRRWPESSSPSRCVPSRRKVRRRDRRCTNLVAPGV